MVNKPRNYGWFEVMDDLEGLDGLGGSSLKHARIQTVPPAMPTAADNNTNGEFKMPPVASAGIVWRSPAPQCSSRDFFSP
jgi:hypothetical protein